MLVDEWRIEQMNVEKQFEAVKEDLPSEIQEEIPEMFDNWRVRYFFLGMNPEEDDIEILAKLQRKLKEVNKNGKN
ncbi:MAG: hypothetical protein GF317_20750 [Candidatus Lokiarchaeota archaeon]|nr:hypothetical protein [Candidatus Lokiarchaeota archaeon]